MKTFGAYVVDKNFETPYVIYVENGASFKLSNATGWDNNVAADLQTIRAALKMVSSVDHFLDGNGNKLVQPYPNQNLLSMRGSSSAWQRSGSTGDATCHFDTWSQSLVFDKATNTSTTFQNWSGLGYNR